MSHPLSSSCLLLALVFAAVASPRAATPVATYQFNGTFNADEAGAPAITPTDPLGTSGFTVDSALGQSRTVWAFDGAASPVTQQAGLTVATAGLVNPRGYSVDFVAKLTQRPDAYRRLVDVSNRQSDAGYYVTPANSIDVYPGSGNTAAWTNGAYHHIVLTNDGTNVNAYIDGVSQFTSATGVLNLDQDAVNNPSRLMGFFLDNVAGGGQGEWSPGAVALIRLWDGVLTPQEASAVLETPFAKPAPTATITSPPEALTLVVGETATVAADAADVSGLLTSVQFYLDDTLLGSVAAPGPYFYEFTVPAAGPHTLAAAAISRDQRRTVSTRAFTSVAADPARPAPIVEILTPAGGRNLAAGTAFILSVDAASNPAGDDLAGVDFYADGVRFASFDAAGNRIDLLGHAAPHAAAAAAVPGSPASSAVFKAQFQMPGVTKLVSMVSVALAKTGAAYVSKPVMVQSVAGAADRPPTVKVSGLADGARLYLSSNSLPVAVDVSDPDGAPAASAATRPVRRAFDASPVIARVQYYLNALQVKDSKEAPFTLPFAPKAAGKYVLTVVATDEANLATISDPVEVEVLAPPKVTLALKGTALLSEGGGKGKAIITRDGDTSAELTVSLKLKGSAVNGGDYQFVSSRLTIPAGESSVKLKLKPIANAGEQGIRTINVKLLASPDGQYIVGSGKKANFTLSDE